MSPIPVNPTPAVASTTDAHAEFVKSVISTVAQVPAYDADEAAKLRKLPDNYITIHLSRRFAEESLRLDGFRTPVAWRLSVRYVSKSVSNARLMRDRVTAALEGNTLDVDEGRVSTPVTFEAGDEIRPDDEGYLTALDDWTYVL